MNSYRATRTHIGTRYSINASGVQVQHIVHTNSIISDSSLVFILSTQRSMPVSYLCLSITGERYTYLSSCAEETCMLGLKFWGYHQVAFEKLQQILSIWIEMSWFASLIFRFFRNKDIQYLHLNRYPAGFFFFFFFYSNFSGLHPTLKLVLIK